MNDHALLMRFMLLTLAVGGWRCSCPARGMP